MKPKALIAWSSGKDSAWALHEARRAGDCEIVGALTTVTACAADLSLITSRADLDAVIADKFLLLDWLKSCSTKPHQVFVNHGEPEASAALADRIRREWDVAVVVPQPGERVRV